VSWFRDHALIIVLVTAYSALMVWHAVEGKRRTRGIADYYVGGRAMGGIALGISFFATYSSTNSFVGFAGQAYSYGVAWLLLAPCAVLFCLIAWAWIAPRLRRFTEQLDSVTIPDFIGFRFDSLAARVAAAVIVLFASFLYMTAVFKGVGTLLATFLDVPYAAAIIIVFVIVVMYTAAGGFISVVKTDVVQGIVMFLGAILLFWGTVAAAGGIGSFFAVAREAQTAPLFSWSTAMPFPVLLGIMVAGTMKFIVEPRQLSRFYALEDERAGRRGMVVSTASFLLVYALLVPIGIYAHRILGHDVADTDVIVPTLLASTTVFHPAVAAFLVISMIAAAMSSLDSVLLVMASTCERDLVSRWNVAPTEQDAVNRTRWYVVAFALITALIALNPPGGIVSLTAFSGSLYAACFFPAIVFGLYWRGGDGKAVLASFAVGIGTLLGWPHLPFGAGVHEVFPAILFSTLAFATMGLMNKDVAPTILFETNPSGVRSPSGDIHPARQ
jgi:SSS family transporter